MYSNRHEDIADEIVIQSSKFFLGINFQCISCHGGAGFLEKVDLGLSKKKREDLWALRTQFAKMLTSHPQFAKATANLFWKEFFGIGIVEPVDGFDLARQDPANLPPAEVFRGRCSIQT